MRRPLVLSILLLLLLLMGFFLLPKQTQEDIVRQGISGKRFSLPPIITPTPAPTSTPTPPPAGGPMPTIDIAKYGPCKSIPILMYHHVNKLSGEQKTSSSLTINTDVFTGQMDYLAQKGYQTITLNQLVDALNGGAVLSLKPVIITFDDGYEDFYTDVFPILKSHNFMATVFVSSGLVESSAGYLTWSEVREMDQSGLVTVGNHTWSHKNLTGKDRAVVENEITTSQTQFESFLGKKPNFFAYPYGADNLVVESVLQQQGFKGAVVTYPHLQCAKLPYKLGRKRIGNTSLSAYGL